MRLNLNDNIKVKLTDLGKDIFYHQYDRLNSIFNKEICKPSMPKVDEDGYTTFQLWEFMELYGVHMGMTLPNVIEPLDIVFDAPTIEPETEEEAYERGYTAGQMAQRKGQWIFVHPLQDNDSGAYMCSVCKTGDWEIKPTDKYCKFCGAKMGEGNVDALTDEIMERYCNECDNHRCKDCKHLQKWISEESAKKFGQIYECARKENR